jgi:hypothetical protein
MDDMVEKYGSGNPPEGQEEWYDDDSPDGCTACDPRTVTETHIVEYLKDKMPVLHGSIIHSILESRGVANE